MKAADADREGEEGQEGSQDAISALWLWYLELGFSFFISREEDV